MLAVLGGHVDAVSLLLEREANVDAVDRHGLTALHFGVRRDDFVVIFVQFSALIMAQWELHVLYLPD